MGSLAHPSGQPRRVPPVALVTFGPEGRAIERLQPEALLDHYDDLPALAARILA